MGISFSNIADKLLPGLASGNPAAIIGGALGLLTSSKENRAKEDLRDIEKSGIAIQRQGHEAELDSLLKQIAMGRIPRREARVQSGMEDSTSGQIDALDYEQNAQAAREALERERRGLELGIKQGEIGRDMDNYLRRMGYLQKGIQSAATVAAMGLGPGGGGVPVPGPGVTGGLGGAISGLNAFSGGATNPFAGAMATGQLATPLFTRTQQRDYGGGLAFGRRL